MSGVQNKKVLITGTSRGIGLAIAQEFLNQGAQVYGTATTKAAPQEFSGFCAADFSKREGIQQCVDFVNEVRPDIVINNAGINTLKRVGLYQDLYALWQDIGLRDENNKDRAAYAVWKSWYNKKLVE